MAEPVVFVTGANGQVGFELVRSLQGLGRICAPLRAELDLSDFAKVRSFLRDLRPNLIVNPAAYTAVDRAETDAAAAHHLNAGLPAVLAEEARLLNATVIHYSTDYVFDGSKAGPYIESDATAPLNVYGASKLAGERALAESGVPHFVFRTSWVYSRRGANFLLTMLRLAQKQASLRIVADQIGAPTWARTIATLTAHAIAQGPRDAERFAQWAAERSGIYHLTASGAASWADFAEEIFARQHAAAAPAVTRIPSSEYPVPARRPANSRLAGDRFRQTFGLSAPDWREALRLCMQEI
ncbi:dTDP-4-dehydrorhamnose reductase [Pigmentiphaga soli]|uniref:dTDP-4-dehydrorhamnose reductase n=2 Tax=Pigmentiphaga soli TaxID=1007095 RepID=A0ABP8HKK4_9BURK